MERDGQRDDWGVSKKQQDASGEYRWRDERTRTGSRIAVRVCFSSATKLAFLSSKLYNRLYAK
jgi:hypothetical protein